VARVVASWDAVSLDSLAPGATLRVSAAPSDSPAAIDVDVRRLSAALFLVQAIGRDSASGARRRSAVLVRADAPQPLDGAAVRARSVAAGLVAQVSGADRPPQGWTCPPSGAAAAAVDLRPGDPDSALLSFGSWSWERLTRWAAGLPAGGDSIGVLFAPAALTLTGGRQLGLVVVDGDLTLRGGAEIVGLVAVRGRLVFDGGGGRIVGGVVAGSLELSAGTPSDAGQVGFSRCAVEAAVLARAPVLPIPSRAVADLFEGVSLR
jgi:hypothetical protein